MVVLQKMQRCIVNISFPAMCNLAYSGYIAHHWSSDGTFKLLNSHGEQHG